ncbi:MAG: alpha/beta hydrolase family protein [Eubacteriales bacterium]
MKYSYFTILILIFYLFVTGCNESNIESKTSDTFVITTSVQSTSEFLSTTNEPDNDDSLFNIIETFNPGELMPDVTFDKDITCYKYTYKSDAETVVGYLSKPTETFDKLPVLIYNRGGNMSYSQLTDETIAALSYLFVEKGYVVLASQYRGVDGGTGTEQFGGSDVNDILNLIEIAKELPYVDANNIFVFGVSRGGMMTYEVCRNNPDIKAAVIDSGVSDLYQTWNSRDDMRINVLNPLIGGSPEEYPDEYDKRSAVKWADEIDVPLLITHSKKDERVDYVQVIDMIKQLDKYDKEYKFISFDDDLHGNIMRVMTDILDWFDKYKDK